MQLLRPLLVFAWLGFGLIYWLWQWPGVFGALTGFAVFWLMLGLGYGYWFGIDREADRMVTELMDWKAARKASQRSAKAAATHAGFPDRGP